MNTFSKEYENGFIIINRNPSIDQKPQEIYIYRNPVMSLILIIFFVNPLSVNLLYEQFRTAIHHMYLFNIAVLVVASLPCAAIVFYCLKALSMVHIPLLTLTPDHVVYQDVFSEMKIIPWKKMRPISLKKSGPHKYRRWTLYIDSFSIDLLETDASPYQLAQVFKDYKKLTIQDTYIMRFRLTYFYDVCFRYRKIVYLFLFAALLFIVNK